MAPVYSTRYTAKDCRSRCQLGENSTASFTFMEQHPFPPAARSAPLYYSAPLSGMLFPATWFSGCCFLLGGVGRRARCVLQEWTLEVVGKLALYTATLHHLPLPLRLTQHAWALVLCCREGATFLTPTSSTVPVKP